jgi:hypothetical protein
MRCAADPVQVARLEHRERPHPQGLVHESGASWEEQQDRRENGETLLTERAEHNTGMVRV